MRCWRIIVVLSLFSSVVWTQKTHTKKVKNIALPVLFYLPETSLGIGATGITTVSPDSSLLTSTRPSIFIYSAAYTFKKQFLLFLPFEIYGSGNDHRIKGEFGFYKYFYNFFGIGPNSEAVDFETYDVTFPRLDVNYAQRLSTYLYVGLGYQYDYFNITAIQNGGLLDSQKPIGYEGGTKSNLYALVFWDNRDNYISSSSGYYFQATIKRGVTWLGSDFEYMTYDLDLRKYDTFGGKFTWANKIQWSVAESSAPFFDLPYISSPMRSRGFDDRRFMDYVLLSGQSEWRFPIKKRFSGVTFVSASFLSGEVGEVFDSSPKIGYGIGLRYELDRKNKTRLRLDIAQGDGQWNIYFTTNEAF
jgi:hypothetical protein